VEAEAFTTAMEFYSRKPIAIYINVSRKWATDRLLGRGRSDDKDMIQLNGRLDWFEEYTMPVVGYFKENNNYTLLEINGEQTIEQVHAEIMQKLGWSNYHDNNQNI
jgi:adenylate kinase family enzyme